MTVSFEQLNNKVGELAERVEKSEELAVVLGTLNIIKTFVPEIQEPQKQLAERIERFAEALKSVNIEFDSLINNELAKDLLVTITNISEATQILVSMPDQPGIKQAKELVAEPLHNLTELTAFAGYLEEFNSFKNEIANNLLRISNKIK